MRSRAVLCQVVIRAAIFSMMTTIDDRSNRDYRPSCMIPPWLSTISPISFWMRDVASMARRRRTQARRFRLGSGGGAAALEKVESEHDST